MPAIFSFDPSGIHLDRARGLSVQLFHALRARILDGQIGVHCRLPSSRELAVALGVSRNTVVHAYEQLYAEGYVEGHTGDGTYVAERVIPQRPSIPERQIDEVVRPESVLIARLKQHYLTSPPSGPPKAFRMGVPALDLFPFETWARLQARFWRRPPMSCLGYSDPAGEWRLRELIAAYLHSARGLACDASQIIITSGAQQAISLCTQVLLSSGEGVVIENPGFRAARHAFASAGAQLHGIPVDAEGMCTDQLHGFAGCRLAYVTPSNQHPTGVTLPLSRRLALLEWAEKSRGWIIEDDYDGEYRYKGTPLMPLAGLDRHGRVVYVGTFSKVVFPALRLGYLVVPHSLIQPFSPELDS
jgi:GntR family transcriptional regulator/MocR family aminotransferase